MINLFITMLKQERLRKAYRHLLGIKNRTKHLINEKINVFAGHSSSPQRG